MVHGWDFAVALDRPLDVSDGRAAHVLGLARQTLTTESRITAGFDPPVPVLADASALDQLVACVISSGAAAYRARAQFVRRYGGAGASLKCDRGLPTGMWSWPVEPQIWEAPVIRQRTSVGLDVHARSVFGCALYGETGQVIERRLTPDHGEAIGWIQSLPGPVSVVYEAGPTGFGLARSFTTAGIECLVAAPSKLIRPAGDRVKTDKRDARHLARLLHLGEVVSVAVPTVEQEAARDLVRARDDCRSDLMSARHRISKLLLRQGIVYYGGRPGRASTNCGCVVSISTTVPCRFRSTPPSTRCCPPWIAVTASMRRSRSWPRIRSSPRSPTGCSAFEEFPP